MSTVDDLKKNKMRVAALAAIVVAAGIALALSANAYFIKPVAAIESGHWIGKVDIVAKHANGQVYDERHFDNLVLNDGFFGTAQRTFGTNGTSVSAVFNYIAIGTSSTAASAAQHVLGGELARAQQATPTYNNSTQKTTISVTFAAGTGTGGIQESGIFNSNTANTGPMLARQTFSIINKGASDSLTVTWTITYS